MNECLFDYFLAYNGRFALHEWENELDFYECDEEGFGSICATYCVISSVFFVARILIPR